MSLAPAHAPTKGLLSTFASAENNGEVFWLRGLRGQAGKKGGRDVRSGTGRDGRDDRVGLVSLVGGLIEKIIKSRMEIMVAPNQSLVMARYYLAHLGKHKRAAAVILESISECRSSLSDSLAIRPQKRTIDAWNGPDDDIVIAMETMGFEGMARKVVVKIQTARPELCNSVSRMQSSSYEDAGLSHAFSTARVENLQQPHNVRDMAVAGAERLISAARGASRCFTNGKRMTVCQGPGS